MKDDLKKYPIYVYDYGILKRINRPLGWNGYQMHHYIKQQKMRYEDYAKIEHLQKLFLLPQAMHIDLHNFIKNFKDKWGIDIKELLYDYENKVGG